MSEYIDTYWLTSVIILIITVSMYSDLILIDYLLVILYKYCD